MEHVPLLRRAGAQPLGQGHETPSLPARLREAAEARPPIAELGLDCGVRYAVRVTGQAAQSFVTAAPNCAFWRRSIGGTAVAGTRYADAEFQKVEHRPPRLPAAAFRR